MSRRILARLAAVVGLTATAVLTAAPGAWANWESHISSWTDGHESRRWQEQSYSEIRFTTCYAQYGESNPKTDVRMFRDRSLMPDVPYDNKTYRNCFTGSGKVSAGEWWDLPSGTYYFRVNNVGPGNSCCLLFVSRVYVDTTLAD